jgi:CBS domain-containing protein
MSIGKICTRSVHIAKPDESVHDAARRMESENVGCLVVLDSGRRPTGILTDRDLATRVVANGRDPRATRVSEVMSAHPRTIEESAPIQDAVATMRRVGVRRLPVVDKKGAVAGIVTADDVLDLVSGELGDLGRALSFSRPGMSPPAMQARGNPAGKSGGKEKSASGSRASSAEKEIKPAAKPAEKPAAKSAAKPGKKAASAKEPARAGSASTAKPGAPSKKAPARGTSARP